MSLIATLCGTPPDFCGQATIYRSEQYRDKFIDEDETAYSDLQMKVQKHLKGECGNRSEMADRRYLDALQDGPLTVKQLASAIDRQVTTVQRQVRLLEAKDLIVQLGKNSNGANPAILWGIK